MAKYLVNATYTAEGTQGLLKEGGTSRQKLIEEMVVKLGGSLECFYYCFGNSDVIAIADVPDSATAAAISMGINSSGAVKLSMTSLLSPSEIDEAAKKTVGYRPPGT
jgi:uncharacterized protein with GYD domain